MPRVILLSSVLFAALVDPLRGQSRLPVSAGSEIRVETTTNRSFRGTLLEGSTDSIRLRQVVRDSVVAIPHEAVLSYSVLTADRRRGAKRGFLIGGGVALGLVTLLTAVNSRGDDLSAQVGLISALPVALVGGGLGATIGVVLAPATWRESVRLHVNRTGGFALGLSRRF